MTHLLDFLKYKIDLGIHANFDIIIHLDPLNFLRDVLVAFCFSFWLLVARYPDSLTRFNFELSNQEMVGCFHFFSLLFVFVCFCFFSGFRLFIVLNSIVNL